MYNYLQSVTKRDELDKRAVWADGFVHIYVT